MCGIVLVGATSMFKKDVEIFEKLLFGDTFRGPHSTGVYTRREEAGRWCPTQRKTLDKKVLNPLFKDAVDGPDFLKTRGWELLRDGFGATANYGNFYVGHNRWRTVGAINGKNAHPFQHGDITMVHNGTLLDQSLLPNSEDFEVDSDNVAFSLDHWGVDKTIQNLDGAFTLIWHNNKNHTLHIIRNEERPFHLAETDGGKWFGASEEDMLMWILNRGKVPYKLKRHFEIEVGVEYIFDVADDKFSLKEERKHELPDFLYSGYYSNYRSGTSSTSGYVPNNAGEGNGAGGAVGGGSGSVDTTGVTGTGSLGPVLDKSTPYKPADQLLKEAGFEQRIGSLLKFRAFDFQHYKEDDKTRGRVIGMYDKVDDYIEVQCHNVQTDEFKEDHSLYGKIAGAYVKNHVLTIVCVDGTRDNPAVGWDLSQQDNLPCSSCGEPMGVLGYPRMNGSKKELICAACLTKGDEPEVEPADVKTEKFECQACDECGIESEVLSIVYRYGEPHSVCDSCMKPSDSFTGEEESKMIGGTTYTQSQWEKKQAVCGSCSSPIAFNECNELFFYNEEPICKGCESQFVDEEAEQEHAKSIIGDDGVGSFVCTGCGETHSLNNESISKRVCKDCHNWFVRPHTEPSQEKLFDEEIPWAVGDTKPKHQTKASPTRCEVCEKAKPMNHGYRLIFGDTYKCCKNCYHSPSVDLQSTLRAVAEEKKKAAAEKTKPSSETTYECECCGKLDTGRQQKRISGVLRHTCKECFNEDFEVNEFRFAERNNLLPPIKKIGPLPKKPRSCEFCGDDIQQGGKWTTRLLGWKHHTACDDCKVHDNGTLRDMLRYMKMSTTVPEEPVGGDDREYKVLFNGMRITKALFLKMNKCECGKEVGWDKAEKAEFRGAQIMCEDCSIKADINENKK